MLSFNRSQIPYGLVTANPVEFDKIYAISKFRSAAGHDCSGTWDGETCRSMKHYFNIGRSELGTTMPIRSYPSAGHPNIKIFTPFDGTIIEVGSEHTPIGKQVHIHSKNFPNFYVRLFHIDLLPGLGTGSEVKSGQQVGTVGPKDGTDVSVGGMVLFKGSVDLSVFEVMTGQAFAPYASAGYKEEFIRDSSNYDFNSDFVFLKPDPTLCQGSSQFMLAYQLQTCYTEINVQSKRFCCHIYDFSVGYYRYCQCDFLVPWNFEI